MIRDFVQKRDMTFRDEWRTKMIDINPVNECNICRKCRTGITGRELPEHFVFLPHRHTVPLKPARDSDRTNAGEFFQDMTVASGYMFVLQK